MIANALWTLIEYIVFLALTVYSLINVPTTHPLPPSFREGDGHLPVAKAAFLAKVVLRAGKYLLLTKEGLPP